MPESNFTPLLSEPVEVTECGCLPVFVQVTVVPGGMMIEPGTNPKSTMLTWLTASDEAETSELGGGGALAGPIVPFSEKTQSVSPRGKSSWKLPPEATATY